MFENLKFKEHGVKHLWVKIRSSRNMVSNIYVQKSEVQGTWCQTFTCMCENLKFKEHGVKHLWVKIKSSRNMMSNICG